MHWLSGLAVFLGACCLTLGGASGNPGHLSLNMEERITNLNDHYTKNLTQNDKRTMYRGSLFLTKLDNINYFQDVEQKLLMSTMLDAYIQIFSDMLNETQDEGLKEDLRHVQHKLKELKHNHFQDKGRDLRMYVEELWAIKTNDIVVQRKALRELKTVYEKASKLGAKVTTKKESRRRRRQAQRAKTQMM